MTTHTVNVGHCLQDLIPTQYESHSFHSLKQRMRYQGSFRLKLKRPNRSSPFNRPYDPGDPAHYIDWRVFARTGQLMVREDHDETPGRVLVLLDVGESLNWPDPSLRKEHGLQVPTKLEIALRVACNLAFSHLKVADMVELAVANSESPAPNRKVAIHSTADVLTFFTSLKDQKFRNQELMRLSEPGYHTTRRYDILYYLSDGMGVHRNQWLSEHSFLLRYLHCLSDLEINSEWLKRDNCYFDHSIYQREYLGSAMLDQASYDRAFEEWRKGLEDGLSQLGAYYQLITAMTPINIFHHEVFNYRP